MSGNSPTTAHRKYFAWVATQGCLVCNGEALIHHITHEHCHDAPEVRITKDHWRVAPLCPYHHVDSKAGIHGIGSQWGFYNMHHINLVDESERLLDQYRELE